MVLVTVADLDDDVYPGVQDYARCQSKAFMKGFIGFAAGGAAGLTGSILARQRFARYSPTYTVSLIAGGAIVGGYMFASIASKECQRLWVRTALDAGYTDDIPGRKPEGASLPSSTHQETLLNSSKGHDETDAPVFKKTKYGDTMG